MDDIKEECSKYGKVLEVKIPRPTGGSRQSNGVGKIYVKFENTESANKALRSLAGRKFADRTVVTTYFSEVSSSPPYSLMQILKIMTGKFRSRGLVDASTGYPSVVDGHDNHFQRLYLSSRKNCPTIRRLLIYSPTKR